jgi:hypothetical protein
LNSALFHQQAAAFADRLEREAGEQPGACIDRAFTLAFCRPPTAEERADSLRFLNVMAEQVGKRDKAKDRANPRKEALRSFCLVLLNANELVTID